MINAKLKPASGDCIIILGMHRSGTSALSGVLKLLGANLGTNLLEAQDDVNPKGFWEHAAVVELQDKFLFHIHSGWWDALPLPGGWTATSEATNFKNGLMDIFQQQFSGHALWAVKDPRTCRLLPLWSEVVAALHVRPNYILILRHPAEVAASLGRRDGFCKTMSSLLWMRNVLDSECDTRGQQRIVMTMDELLSSWQSVFLKAESAFGISFPLHDASVVARINAFLEPSLRHHTVRDVDANDPVMALAVEAYEAIIREDHERIDRLRIRFEQEVERLRPWLEQTNGLMLKLMAGKASVRASEDAAKASKAEVERIKATPSWRITAPLRTIANFFRNQG